jgi:hypothetical protein
MFRYSTRLVLLLPRIVVKIPLSKRGYLQCKNEKKMWDKYKDFGILGKLYWEWNGIVCMKRYDVVELLESEKEKREFTDTVFGIKHIISEFDIDRCDLHKVENWGKNNGDYVLLDYGINEEVSNMY